MALAVLILLGVLAILIILENLVVCGLVALYKPLRTFTNGFIVSLAFADLLYGAVIIPMNIFYGPPMVLNYLITAVLLANVSTLLCVTCDRYLVVMHPLVYQPVMERHFYKIIIASWFLPLIISLIPLLYSSNFSLLEHKIFVYFIVALGIVVPYLAILLAYVRIFHRVASHVKYLAQNYLSDEESEVRQEGKRVTAEARVARIFAVIAIIFLITWMPIIYMTVVHNVGRPDLIPRELITISWFTLSLGSLINAPIYAFAKKDFNSVIRRIICYKERSEELGDIEGSPTNQFHVTEA